MTTKKRSINITIALYGTTQSGSGTITSLPDGRMLGNGELVKGRGATEAIWAAVEEALTMLNCGPSFPRGATVTVTMDVAGRGFQCICDANHVPYFGSMKWTPQQVARTLSTAEVLAAAGKVS